MKKSFLTLSFLISFIAIGQSQSVGSVGINTISPTATLHVEGDLKIIAKTGALTDSILVIRDKLVMKIAVSDLLQSLQQPTTVVECPTFVSNQSSGYSLLFKTTNQNLINPNATIVIDGKTFQPSGNWTQGNNYLYGYTNITGIALNINQTFTVNFTGQQCTYN